MSEPQARRNADTERSWLATRWLRLDGPRRLAGIDLARGLAVLGMFAAHLLWTSDFEWSQPGTWADVANGRSSILFATLAGVSVGLAAGGRTRFRGAALRTARVRITARAAFVWVLGLILVATGVPVYVILPAYGILFLLTIPFLSLPARTLFIVAGALGALMPFVQVLLDALPFWQTVPGELLSVVVGWHYPFTTWIAFVLCGLGVGRLDLRSARAPALVLGAGAALAAIGYGLDAVSGPGDESSYWGAVWTARAHSTGLLEVIGSGGFALAVIGACLLACRTWLRWVAVPLRAVGAMPLTAYTAQLVVWAAIATSALGDVGDLAGFRDLQPFWPMAIGTVVGCTLWALLVGRGPLEWAVDRVSRLAARNPLA